MIKYGNAVTEGKLSQLPVSVAYPFCRIESSSFKRSILGNDGVWREGNKFDFVDDGKLLLPWQIGKYDLAQRGGVYWFAGADGTGSQTRIAAYILVEINHLCAVQNTYKGGFYYIFSAKAGR